MKYRFDSLDCLRFFAAAGVILFHVNGNRENWTHNLYLCVDLFFILSGFVLEPAFPTARNLKDCMRFIIRRYIRLAPMIYSTVAFSILYHFAIKLKHSSGRDHLLPNLEMNISTIAFSLLFLQIFSSQSLLINYPMWSLSTEWIVNLLLIYPLSGKSRIRNAGIVYIVGFILQGLNLASPQPEILMQLSRGFTGITLGVILRIMFNQREIRMRNRSFPLYFSCLFVSCFLVTQANTSIAPLLSGLPFAILILGLAQMDRKKRFEIPKNVVYWAGTLSFGIYAWHVPLSGIVERYSPDNFQANTISRLIVLTTLSCVFGYIVSNYFERPVQRYLQKFVELKLR